MADNDALFSRKRTLDINPNLKDTNFAINKKCKKKNYRLLRKQRKLKHKAQRKRFWRKQNSKALYTFPVFDNTDMERQPPIPKPIEEVASWFKMNDLSYWKSRALALEAENTALHNCIRNLCNQQIIDYVEYIKENLHLEDQSIKKETKKKQHSGYCDDEDLCKTPIAHPSTYAKKLMKELYGEHASKINGMETAIQLKYNSYFDKHGPALWPNIPLKL